VTPAGPGHERRPVVLVLRALGLGDLLTAVPALRALRRTFVGSSDPAAELVLAGPAALAPLLPRTRTVDRLVAVPAAVRTPPGPLPTSADRPWLAVNLHGSGPQSTVALRTLAPARLWSFGTPSGPPWRDDEHEVDRWCRLLTWYGCDVDRDDLYLDSGPADQPRPGPVVVHPGAADIARRWPAARFADVTRGLAERGHAVRLTAGPEERPLATWVAARAGLPREAVISSMDLDELAELVAASPLVVAGDTGVAHLATACRTPSVVIFGPQPPSRWGPPANGHHEVLWSPSPHDGSVSDQPHPALLRISPADVLSAADRLLTREGQAGHPIGS